MADLSKIKLNGTEYDLKDAVARMLANTQADWDQTDTTALDYIKNKPQQITEQNVADWGFTKNTGTYIKPVDGIPASDLASAVQTSLGKADTALQSHQSLSGYATEQWVENKGYLTQHQDISGKADKIAVTASDNGKFLRVVNGAWAAVEVPSAESASFGGGN